MKIRRWPICTIIAVGVSIFYTNKLFAAFKGSPHFFNSWKETQEKQKKKENSRWTIEDWLSQKSRLNGMDYWLAMNTSPVNWEFALGGSQWKYKTESSASWFHSESGQLSLFYRIIGLTFQYIQSSEDIKKLNGRFNLRILGTSLQSTQVTLFYGEEEIDDKKFTSSYRSPFVGAELNLYLTHYLGVEGEYAYFFSVNRPDQTSDVSQMGSYGPFLEWGILRIFARWQTEFHTYEDKSGLNSLMSSTHEIKKGWELGLRFYF